MKSSVDKDGFQRCYDGIIRSLSPFTRWDIGFVEVKSCDKSVELDKVKIIDVLIRSLNGISKVVTNNDVMVQVLVFGICCQGICIQCIFYPLSKFLTSKTSNRGRNDGL